MSKRPSNPNPSFSPLTSMNLTSLPEGRQQKMKASPALLQNGHISSPDDFISYDGSEKYNFDHLANFEDLSQSFELPNTDVTNNYFDVELSAANPNQTDPNGIGVPNPLGNLLINHQSHFGSEHSPSIKSLAMKFIDQSNSGNQQGDRNESNQVNQFVNNPKDGTNIEEENLEGKAQSQFKAESSGERSLRGLCSNKSPISNTLPQPRMDSLQDQAYIQNMPSTHTFVPNAQCSNLEFMNTNHPFSLATPLALANMQVEEMRKMLQSVNMLARENCNRQGEIVGKMGFEGLVVNQFNHQHNLRVDNRNLHLPNQQGFQRRSYGAAPGQVNTLDTNKPQNLIRNSPGCLTKRVVMSITTYLMDDGKEMLFDSVKFDYIANKLPLFCLTMAEEKSFLKYLEDFDPRGNYWGKVMEAVEKHKYFGVVLMECVIGFLSEEGKIDFEEYMNDGKLEETHRTAILAKKNKLKKGFEKRLEKLALKW